MRSMTTNETMQANGGKTEYLQCPFCGKKFWYSYWLGISYCLARGQAAIELRSHETWCCLEYC